MLHDIHTCLEPVVVCRICHPIILPIHQQKFQLLNDDTNLVLVVRLLEDELLN